MILISNEIIIANKSLCRILRLSLKSWCESIECIWLGTCDSNHVKVDVKKAHILQRNLGALINLGILLKIILDKGKYHHRR